MQASGLLIPPSSLRIVARFYRRQESLGVLDDEHRGALQLTEFVLRLLPENGALDDETPDRDLGRHFQEVIEEAGRRVVGQVVQHPTLADFRAVLGAEEVEPWLSLRIAYHLVGGECQQYYDSLTAAGPPPQDAASSTDPMVLALRRLADDRPLRQLPAVIQPLVATARGALSFGRLVFEEALGVEVAMPAERVVTVAAAGRRILPMAALRLKTPDFFDLSGLFHVALGEAWRRAGELTAAGQDLELAAECLAGGRADPKVASVLVAARSRFETDVVRTIQRSADGEAGGWTESRRQIERSAPVGAEAGRSR